VAPRARLLALVAALPLLGGVVGCGDHGTAAAIEACSSFSKAVNGYVTPQQRETGLADALRWAGKAAGTDGRWRDLVTALGDYRAAVAAPDAPGPAARRRLADDRAIIRNNCELASRGY
jgi:hypothetical protein